MAASSRRSILFFDRIIEETRVKLQIIRDGWKTLRLLKRAGRSVGSFRSSCKVYRKKTPTLAEPWLEDNISTAQKRVGRSIETFYESFSADFNFDTHNDRIILRTQDLARTMNQLSRGLEKRGLFVPNDVWVYMWNEFVAASIRKEYEEGLLKKITLTSEYKDDDSYEIKHT